MLFWGAVIVVALVAAYLIVRRAFESPRSRGESDDAGRPVVNQQRIPTTAAEPIADQSPPITKPHRHRAEPVVGDTVEDGHIKDPDHDPLINSLVDSMESTDGAGFSKREQEEFLLTYGPRNVRKAIRERRNARKQAQKKQSQS
jgi:hypothetical protein